MLKKLAAALDAHGSDLAIKILEGVELARASYVPISHAAPPKVFSTMATEVAKHNIRELDAVERDENEVAAIHVLSHDGEEFRFRVHRARLSRRAARDGDYDAEHLIPQLNGIRKGTTVDFVLLWVSEDDEQFDLWACVPASRLVATPNTQLASFKKVNGKRWAWSIPLTAENVPAKLAPLTPGPSSPGKPAKKPLDGLALRPVDQEVELTFADERAIVAEPDTDAQTSPKKNRQLGG